MKTIKLITKSEFFRESQFSVGDFYGKQTIIFRYTEREFVDRSLIYHLFSNDLKPLPSDYGRDSNIGVEYSRYDYCYCNTDNYIVVDKGTTGFDSVAVVNKCHIEETDKEFIITIELVTAKSVMENVLLCFYENNYNISSFLHENFFSRINTYSTSVPELVKKIEETNYMDMSLNNNSSAISLAVPLNIDETGCYKIKPHRRNYTQVNPKENIDVGTLLYTSLFKNTLEIVEITNFVHNVYGLFSAIVKNVFVYPRDSKEIKKKLPTFYKDYCITDNELSLKEFIGTPEELSFIPTNTKLGDNVVYQELVVANSRYGINNKTFQFMMNNNRGFGNNKTDGYSTGIDSSWIGGTCLNDMVNDCGFIWIEHDTLVGTLINVDTRFMIVFYKVCGVVKFKGKLWVKFTFEDNSDWFDDFSSVSKNSFRRVQYRNACRNVEFLLCRGVISPVVVDKAEFPMWSVWNNK